MRRRRLPNPKLAKTLRSYNVEEIAALYDRHEHTVRNWLASGLEPIDDHRPLMVHGSALNAFHASRRAKAKRPCGPGELYCVGCRKPQRPAGDMVDCVAVNAKVWKLTAICPGCGRLLSQRVGADRLAEFRALIDLSLGKE